MEFNLLTRDECQEIVKNSEAFYCTTTEVEGYLVEMYDYRLASYTDFEDNKAYELRGLTFIEVSPGVWERNILMSKFFNCNQTINWMYEDLKDKKIVRVQDKLDGSIISFVKFPNGKVFAKSKMSFTSDQAIMAQEIYDTNQNVRVLVNTEIERGHVPIFELVSPNNQIVLEYDETKLVLLQIRNAETGEYTNKDYMNSICKSFMVEMAQDLLSNVQVLANTKMINALPEKIDVSLLDVLLEQKEILEGIEGFITTFEDGQMAKIKTDWYLRLHGLIGPDAFRENLLIETILNGQIDDVLGNLVEGTKKDKIKDIEGIVNHKFNHYVQEYKNLRGLYFNKFDEDRKSFAMKYKQNEVFPLVMRNLNTSFTEVEQIAEKSVKEFILNKTKRLKDAKDWLI